MAIWCVFVWGMFDQLCVYVVQCFLHFSRTAGVWIGTGAGVTTFRTPNPKSCGSPGLRAKQWSFQSFIIHILWSILFQSVTLTFLADGQVVGWAGRAALSMTLCGTFELPQNIFPGAFTRCDMLSSKEYTQCWFYENVNWFYSFTHVLYDFIVLY